MVEISGPPRLVIEVDPETGQITWTCESMDGVQVLGVIAQVAVDLHRYWFGRMDRPPLVSKPAKLCINFDGDRIWMNHSETDGNVAQGLLFATIIGLAEKIHEGDYDPAVALLGAIPIEVNRG